MLRIVSIFLSVYVIYVLNYFETTYSIAHPMTYFNNKYIFHPIYNTKKKKSMICQFGHDSSWFIALFILLRYYLMKHKLITNSQIKKLSLFVLGCVFVVSLVNLNAVLYLTPYFLIEYMYIKQI